MKKIYIYTTDYCPYCVKAKNLLKNLNISYEEIDLSKSPDLRTKLMEATKGARTVPQIFIGGDMENFDHYVGGCDDLYALHESKKLLDLL